MKRILYLFYMTAICLLCVLCHRCIISFYRLRKELEACQSDDPDVRKDLSIISYDVMTVYLHLSFQYCNCVISLFHVFNECAYASLSITKHHCTSLCISFPKVKVFLKSSLTSLLAVKSVVWLNGTFRDCSDIQI